MTARGSGTGLSGTCVPGADGVVMSFERMNGVLEIDTDNHVAVVQPGVTLAELGYQTTQLGLCYPVHPGEQSASFGGTIGTNAGGMHAVRHGVTRHHVLGVEAVLASGAVVRTGEKYVKTSTGYDLAQLIVGSEGTLAPRPRTGPHHRARLSGRDPRSAVGRRLHIAGSGGTPTDRGAGTGLLGRQVGRRRRSGGHRRTPRFPPPTARRGGGCTAFRDPAPAAHGALPTCCRCPQ
ncbi:FAD-binding oxidoreductase [Streptomyces prunicolor]|uniref:FAD-binding oxidoreductase n=1 Tax=Streptomyces prunicolor TaxID=67348 RepID=UPI0034169293